MVKNRTYRTSQGKYLNPDEIIIEGSISIYTFWRSFVTSDNGTSHLGKTAKSKETGEELVVAWEKMSKSKNNGVDPSKILETHGVDMTRLLLLYRTDPRAHLLWNDEGKLTKKCSQLLI